MYAVLIIKFLILSNLQNMRLNTKINLLNTNVPISDFSAIIFSETWLRCDLNSSELGFFNYSIYRCDRSSNTSCLTRGGGVLIAIKNKFFSVKLNIDTGSLELIFVLIKVNDRKKIILSCVYFPPNSDSTLYQSYFNIIEDVSVLYPNTDLLLFGDFNLPHLNKAMPNPNLNLASSESIFLQKISLLNLFQTNSILNSKNSMLDLILSNSPSSYVSLHNDPIVPIDAYHPHSYINYLFDKSFLL